MFRPRLGNSNAFQSGNPNPIAKFADSLDSVNIGFPDHHHTKRWKDASAPRGQYSGQYKYLGRLDESVDYRYLPSSVQNPELAKQIGSLPQTVQEGGDSCGSPGEVANEALRGHRYHIHVTKETNDDHNKAIYKEYANKHVRIDTLSAPLCLRVDFP